MANGNETSSSNPQPTEVVPRQGRGRAPQGRGNRPGELIPPSQTPPVMGVPGQSAFTPYARPQQQPMGVPGRSAFSPYARSPQQQLGVPGQSAFSPYTRPGQPRCSPLGSGVGMNNNEGVGLEGGVGFQGAQAVPVGGSGSGDVAAPGALRIGAGGAGGDQPFALPDNQVRCTVCGRVFRTPKALFGHMRTHPDRGWKGAHPPPMFRAEEEFADLREEAEAGGEEAMGEEEGEEYSIPDLNKQPPPHDSN